MDLTELYGSPLPNAGAVVSVVVLAAAALKLRVGFRWGFVLLAVVVAGVVAAKNIAYQVIIAGPNAENSVAAHSDYSVALRWVAITLMLVAGCILLAGFMGKNFLWLPVFVALATFLAATCMFDWHQAYAVSAPPSPVRFELGTPLAQYSLTALMLPAGVAAVVATVRRKRPTAGR